MSESKGAQARVTIKQDYYGKELSLESGWIAKQAGGAVVARQGDTMILATVCRANPRPDQNFFPLTVEYQEKFYAAGKIPGGFFRREGRPAELEILTCRLIDRPIRPMFPEGYMDEVQIICTVLSSDGINNPDILAISAASAALTISEIPFLGPIAGVRVGRIDKMFVLNPDKGQLEKSDIDVIVAGSKDAITMVEGGAKFAPEADLLDALMFGHDEIKKICAQQEELRARVGKAKMEFISPVPDAAIEARVMSYATERVTQALLIVGKHERSDAVSVVEKDLLAATAEEFPERPREVKDSFHNLIYKLVRDKVLDKKVRIDGRGLADVRHVECELGILPRAHGSSLFTRGETQAIVSATLGTGMDAQRMDALSGSFEKTFMLHYNFPPYSTGEAKMLRGTGRREVGHGVLAERALRAVMPSQKEFPYVVRVVSDITESNGSSSMASVCGGSLALMDAGVKISQPVAGVAMGLIKDGSRIAVLTDILGDEDHLGDMDFKVCGTREGITAIQMDIKCDGLTRQILAEALDQARAGRLHILEVMERTINKPRTELSQFAPTISTIKINPDKIRDVIGPGGKTIRSITESTGVKIDISDDGTVSIASADGAAAKRAIEIIQGLTEEAEIGKIYCGVVKRIVDFGAFVEILPGLDGLVHISQLSEERVNAVTDILKEGDEVMVRVLDIDKQGKVRLSRKDALPQNQS